MPVYIFVSSQLTLEVGARPSSGYDVLDFLIYQWLSHLTIAFLLPTSLNLSHALFLSHSLSLYLYLSLFSLLSLFPLYSLSLFPSLSPSPPLSALQYSSLSPI